MKKLKIAVTGGIASGKSLVCKVFSDAGYQVIKADEIAKAVMKTDPTVRQQIISAFGKESYIDDELNRQYLAEKIFPSIENVDKINSIVHPPTVKKVIELMNEALETKNLVFHEAALIYEANIEDLFDYVLLVQCDDKLKVERAVKRSGLTEEQVLQRMQNQILDSEKAGHADFVINNDKSIEELKEKTQFFLSLFESLSK